MARIRTIKPEFFKNEQLSELKMDARLLFIGLWTMADREGRLIDRPKRIKSEIFPYDSVNVEKALAALAEKKLITRYTATVADSDEKLIQINSFLKHQRPNVKELPSTYPAPIQTIPSMLGKERKGREQEREGNGEPPSQEEPSDPEAEKKEGNPPAGGAPLLKRIGEDVPYEDVVAMREISVCYDVYLSPTYQKTREDICAMRGMLPERLKEWVEAFNRSLISDGCRGKTMADYASHLSRWMNKQIASNNTEPKTLYSNGKSTDSTQRDVQSAFDKIDRMYGSAK